jgi:hypothetical protein
MFCGVLWSTLQGHPDCTRQPPAMAGTASSKFRGCEVQERYTMKVAGMATSTTPSAGRQ